jgi:hypothetical protein
MDTERELMEMARLCNVEIHPRVMAIVMQWIRSGVSPISILSMLRAMHTAKQSGL